MRGVHVHADALTIAPIALLRCTFPLSSLAFASSADNVAGHLDLGSLAGVELLKAGRELIVDVLTLARSSPSTAAEHAAAEELSKDVFCVAGMEALAL